MPCLVRCSLVLVLMGGCSAANADFDDPRSSTGDSGGETGDTEVGVDETAADTVASCELHEDKPIRLEVTDPTGIVAPNCAGEMMWRTPIGRVQYPPGKIEVSPCMNNDCTQCGDATISFDFMGSVDTAASPTNCGEVVAWAGRSGNDECVWRGVVLLDGWLPTFVASNERAPAPLYGFQVGLASDALCDGTCPGSASPGRHAIVVVNDEVTPETSPQELEVDMANNGSLVPYEFIARSASVTEDCREQVSWTARELPD